MKFRDLLIFPAAGLCLLGFAILAAVGGVVSVMSGFFLAVFVRLLR